MIQLTTRRRRLVLNSTRAAAVASAAMLVVSLGAGSPASAAGANAGSLLLQVPPPDASAGQPLTSGVQTTPFALVPPAGAACSGDSATGGYRVNSYIVPASVDPGTLQWDSNGPTPQVTGANLSEPLFSSSNTPFVNATTAVSTGQLTGLPPFSFAVFGASGPAVVPAGTYNVGLACTLGPKSSTQEDKYWNVQMTFGADANGLTWTVVAGTTTSSSSSSSSSSSASSSSSSSTSTTVHATTTTVHATTTSSTTSSSSTTTTAVRSLAPTATSSGSSLANTGSSPLPVVLWAMLLLVFGRLAILFGRPLRVRPPDKR
ncbi:MAG: hypothetical protein ACXVLX_15420 [Ilumatobacteraceae bacterium]